MLAYWHFFGQKYSSFVPIGEGELDTNSEALRIDKVNDVVMEKK